MQSLDHRPVCSSAYLVALDAGCAYREYRIDGKEVTIGRDGDRCDIVVAGATVSRCHARIAADEQGHLRLTDLDSTNGVLVNGSRITGTVPLQDGDLVGLGAGSHLRFQRQSSRSTRQFTLAAKSQWLIGRAADCDLSLPFEPMVSSHHALIKNQDGQLRITDNHSLNGTWVNDRPLHDGILAAGDSVVIGSTHFQFALQADGSLSVQQRECGQALRLECIGLSRTVASKGRNASRVLLNDITLALEPGEFVGILGPSGAGKTTLLTALNGSTRPSSGQVLLNETPLSEAYAMLRNAIGYVPQDDILHPELSVEDSLHYLALLRLSPDISQAQRTNIVDATIETLGLQQVRQCPIHQLSGGQRKRVSIGAELIVRPSILFLDEPTAGLDPSVEERLMRHFRGMADRGTTVVITTHVLYNLDLLDKVVILSQGKLVFFGTPREALAFFSEDDIPLDRPNLIFDQLTGEAKVCFAGSDGCSSSDQEAIAARYAHKFRHSGYYAEYVEDRLSSAGQALLAAGGNLLDRTRAQHADRPARGRIQLPRIGRGRPAFEGMRSWLVLSRRHLHQRCLAPKRLVLLLVIPLVLALVTLSQHIEGPVDDQVMRTQKARLQEAVRLGGPYMESQLKSLLSPAGTYDPRSGADLLYALRNEGFANLPVPMSVLLMMVMTAIFSGTLIACLEISAEKSIYRRERMSYLRIPSYLASKLPFCLLVTALQCLVFLALCWCTPGLRQAAFVPTLLVMVAIAWSSVSIGLLLSCVDPSNGRFSVLLAIAVVLPQLLLSGGLGPDFYRQMDGVVRNIANMLPARWGLEMVCTSLFNSFSGESVQWIPDLIRKGIGFDFGGGVYYTGACLLTAQFLLWLVLAAWILKRRDTTC
jgi:ABC-type multidrug transport system ATPase subunit/pSer/pThr/pTyr-binding forkhead associated (FHA) protein